MIQSMAPRISGGASVVVHNSTFKVRRDREPGIIVILTTLKSLHLSKPISLQNDLSDVGDRIRPRYIGKGTAWQKRISRVFQPELLDHIHKSRWHKARICPVNAQFTIARPMKGIVDSSVKCWE